MLFFLSLSRKTLFVHQVFRRADELGGVAHFIVIPGDDLYKLSAIDFHDLGAEPVDDCAICCR